MNHGGVGGPGTSANHRGANHGLGLGMGGMQTARAQGIDTSLGTMAGCCSFNKKRGRGLKTNQRALYGGSNL